MKRIECVATDTVRVAYYVAPDAEFTIVPKTAAGCTPFTAQFANTTIDTDSTGSTFYTWNFGNITSLETTDHDNLVERTFYNTSDHDSTLQIWLTTGIKIPGNKTCYDTDSSEITIFAVPTAKFTVSPQRQMQPSTQFSMYAVQVPGDEVRYAWSYGDGQGSVWNNNAEFEKTLTHKYMDFGEYKIVLDVKNKYCAASDTQIVIIDAAPPKRTMQSKGFKGCEPYLHELIEEVLYADSVRWDIYEVTDSLELRAQMMVEDQKLATYLFNKPGRYLLYQYAFGPGADGEVYMRTDTVTVFSTPIVDYEAYPDTVRLPNQALYTSNSSINGARYLWDFGDGETSSEKEPTHYYTKDGDFYVTLKVTSSKGCTTQGKQQHVRVEPEGMLRFPNAFVPNPAGPNDGHEVKTHNWVFIPTPRSGIKAGTYKLQIFNRYGEKIFESTDPEIGWNGYYRGSLCNQDVYVWKCNCIFENGKIYKKIGNVTLLR
jgi:gliding motility-associated-like protein